MEPEQRMPSTWYPEPDQPSPPKRGLALSRASVSINFDRGLSGRLLAKLGALDLAQHRS